MREHYNITSNLVYLYFKGGVYLKFKYLDGLMGGANRNNFLPRQVFWNLLKPSKSLKELLPTETHPELGKDPRTITAKRKATLQLISFRLRI